MSTTTLAEDETTTAPPVKRSWWRRHSPPYILSALAGAWLVLFFLIPLVSELLVSLMSGNVSDGYTFTWDWSNYRDLFIGSDVPYLTFLVRSLIYGTIATVLTIVIGYPIAYYIAFRVSARWKATLLSLIMVSFLVSYVIRTNMWVFLLGGNGPVLSGLRDLHLVGSDFHILGTPAAVIFGLTYNDLPFMVLPIYVVLERMDTRLFEAAGDLYATKRETFMRTTLPLSRSGIFSGILLVFIDCVGDPVNSQLLGGKTTYMVGQAIQDAFLTNQTYNVAAALSTVLMILLGLILFLYARIVGTDNIEDLV